MAGLSLTLIWFSEALEAQWQAPAYTSAFRRGAVIAAQPRQASSDDECQQQTVPAASDASRSAAVRVVAMVDALAEVVIANVDELGRIDAVAGDGDHGMVWSAACEQRAKVRINTALGAGAGTVLQQAADAWADNAGGTSGAIWGVILNTLGTALGNQQQPQADTVVGP